MIMKKLIFTFCITILCGFCFCCGAQAFADDTLEIYRLYESDFDMKDISSQETVWLTSRALERRQNCSG